MLGEIERKYGVPSRLLVAIRGLGDIELSEMRGSWAGAMGRPQFMPSSYLNDAESGR